jgi:hypothetical protein
MSTLIFSFKITVCFLVYFYTGSNGATLLGVGGAPGGSLDTKGLSFDIKKEDQSLTKITGKAISVELERLDIKTSNGLLSFLPNSIDYKKNDATWKTTYHEERQEFKKNDNLLLQITASERLNRYDWMWNGNGYFKDIILENVIPTVGDWKDKDKSEKLDSSLGKVITNYCLAERKIAGRDLSICTNPEYFSSRYTLLQLLEYMSRIYLTNTETTFTQSEKFNELLKKLQGESSKVGADQGKKEPNFALTDVQYYLLSNTTASQAKQLTTLDTSLAQLLLSSQEERLGRIDSLSSLNDSLIETKKILSNQLRTLENEAKTQMMIELQSINGTLGVLQKEVSSLSLSVSQTEQLRSQRTNAFDKKFDDLLQKTVPNLISSELVILNQTFSDELKAKKNYFLQLNEETSLKLEKRVTESISLLEENKILPLEKQFNETLSYSLKEMNISLNILRQEYQTILYNETIPSIQQNLEKLATELKDANESSSNFKLIVENYQQLQTSSLITLEDKFNHSSRSLQENLQNLKEEFVPTLLTRYQESFALKLQAERNHSNELTNNISLAIANSNSIFAKIIHEVNQSQSDKLDRFVSTAFVPFQQQIQLNLSDFSQEWKTIAEKESLAWRKQFEQLENTNFFNQTIVSQSFQEQLQDLGSRWNKTIELKSSQTKELFEFSSNQIEFLKERLANQTAEMNDGLNRLSTATNQSLEEWKKTSATELSELNESLLFKQDNLKTSFEKLLDSQQQWTAGNFSQLTSMHDQLNNSLATATEKQDVSLQSLNESLTQSLSILNESQSRDLSKTATRFLLQVALLNISFQDELKRINDSFDSSAHEHLHLFSFVNQSIDAWNRSLLVEKDSTEKNIFSLNQSLSKDLFMLKQDLSEKTETELQKTHQTMNDGFNAVNHSLIVLKEEQSSNFNRLSTSFSQSVETLNVSFTEREVSNQLQLNNRITDLNQTQSKRMDVFSNDLVLLRFSLNDSHSELQRKTGELSLLISASQQQSNSNFSNILTIVQNQSDHWHSRFSSFYENDYLKNQSTLQNLLLQENRDNSNNFQQINKKLLDLTDNQTKSADRWQQLLITESNSLGKQLNKTQDFIISVQLDYQQQFNNFNESFQRSFLSFDDSSSRKFAAFLEDTRKMRDTHEKSLNVSVETLSRNLFSFSKEMKENQSSFQNSLQLTFKELENFEKSFQQSLLQNLSFSLERQQLISEKNFNHLSSQLQQSKDLQSLQNEKQDKALQEMKIDSQQRFHSLETEKLSNVHKELSEIQKKQTSLHESSFISSFQLSQLSNHSEKLQKELETMKDRSITVNQQIDRLAQESSFNQTMTNFQLTQLQLEHQKLHSNYQNLSTSVSSSFKGMEREVQEIQKNLSLTASHQQLYEKSFSHLENKVSNDLMTKIHQQDLKLQETSTKLSVVESQLVSVKGLDQTMKELSSSVGKDQIRLTDLTSTVENYRQNNDLAMKAVQQTLEKQNEQNQQQFKTVEKTVSSLETANKLNERIMELIMKDDQKKPTSPAVSTESVAAVEARLLGFYEKEQTRLNQVIEKQQTKLTDC